VVQGPGCRVQRLRVSAHGPRHTFGGPRHKVHGPRTGVRVSGPDVHSPRSKNKRPRRKALGPQCTGRCYTGHCPRPTDQRPRTTALGPQCTGAMLHGPRTSVLVPRSSDPAVAMLRTWRRLVGRQQAQTKIEPAKIGDQTSKVLAYSKGGQKGVGGVRLAVFSQG